MLHVHYFTFNPVQENTYILCDDTKECVIIDPGCYGSDEQHELKAFIETNGLKPVHLLLTHAHVDHVPGLGFAASTYNLVPQLHELELPVLRAVPSYSDRFGMSITDIPEEVSFLEEGDTVAFGNTELKVLFAPGHSPGSICYYSAADKVVVGGDVLFRGSIGRTDLPGGDFNVLMRSIAQQLFVLPDEVTVYAGHGDETTIGREKKFNPFLDYILKAG